MTRSATDIGRGLAPARRARKIDPGERIHVIGAAGAGASAAALLARNAGADVIGLRSRRPVSLHAAAHRSRYRAGVAAQRHPRSRQARRAARGSCGRDQGTHLHRAGPPGAGGHPRGRRAPGGVAAGDRRCRADARRAADRGGRARTASPRRPAGWCTCWSARAAIPAAFVGALLPADLTGGTPSHRALGQRRRLRGGGGRVRRQLRSVPDGPGGGAQRGVGSPGRVRGRGGRARRLRGVADRSRAQSAARWSSTSATVAARSSPTGSRAACCAWCARGWRVRAVRPQSRWRSSGASGRMAGSPSWGRSPTRRRRRG